MAFYERRDITLRQLGFATYQDYLGSALWRRIRSKILNRSRGRCEVCGGRATEVHHRSYCKMALLGKRPEYLVAICRDCHGKGEFDGVRKTTPFEANSRIHAIARSNGEFIVGLCHVCHKNPPKRGRILCGNCARKKKQSAGQ